MSATAQTPRPGLLAARIVLAVIGGYLLTNWMVVWLSLALILTTRMQRGDAMILASLLGFLIYLAVLIWAFAERSWPRLVGVLVGGGLLSFALAHVLANYGPAHLAMGGALNMEPKFRESMGWLHTWTGVVLGGLLFVVFWTGTLAVFDREIDRWMMPMTRLSAPQAPFSADLAWRETGAQAKGSSLWMLQFPTDREPTARVLFVGSSRHVNIVPSSRGASVDTQQIAPIHIDPATGAILPDPGTKAGSEFIFPFHWHLMLGEGSIGQWIVGLAGMVMLVSIVSGVIIHKQIFSQFFTFRPRKAAGRTILDLHNVMGVLGLPFHFMIAFSGLAIFFFFYFPSAVPMIHEGGLRQFYAESREGYSRPIANAPGSTASLDAMVLKAEALWGGGTPAQITISHPGDAKAFVEVTRTVSDVVVYDKHSVFFDAHTGALLKYSAIHPVARVQRFIAGIHFIFFRHWLLRWIYFVLGATGCVLIATGFLFWLQARKKLHGNSFGVRLVHGMTVGSVTGVIIGTVAFFVVNRLLPLGLEGRAEWEIRTFFAAWILAFAHAWLRPRRAWIEQCWAIALGGAAAVALNAITTGDNLIRTLSEGQWAVAGMDLVLLSGALAAAFSASGLERNLRGRATPIIASSKPVRNA